MSPQPTIQVWYSLLDWDKECLAEDDYWVVPGITLEKVCCDIYDRETVDTDFGGLSVYLSGESFNEDCAVKLEYDMKVDDLKLSFTNRIVLLLGDPEIMDKRKKPYREHRLWNRVENWNIYEARELLDDMAYNVAGIFEFHYSSPDGPTFKDLLQAMEGKEGVDWWHRIRQEDEWKRIDNHTPILLKKGKWLVQNPITRTYTDSDWALFCRVYEIVCGTQEGVISKKEMDCLAWKSGLTFGC